MLRLSTPPAECVPSEVCCNDAGQYDGDLDVWMRCMQFSAQRCAQHVDRALDRTLGMPRPALLTHTSMRPKCAKSAAHSYSTPPRRAHDFGARLDKLPREFGSDAGARATDNDDFVHEANYSRDQRERWPINCLCRALDRVINSCNRSLRTFHFYNQFSIRLVFQRDAYRTRIVMHVPKHKSVASVERSGR